MLSCVYICEHCVREPVCEHDVCVISTGFANCLRTVHCEPSPVGFSTNTKDVCGSMGTMFV